MVLFEITHPGGIMEARLETRVRGWVVLTRWLNDMGVSPHNP